MCGLMRMGLHPWGRTYSLSICVCTWEAALFPFTGVTPIHSTLCHQGR